MRIIVTLIVIVRVMGIVRVIVRTIRVIIMRGFGVLRGLGLWFKVFRSRAGKVLLQDFRLGYSRRSYIPTYLIIVTLIVIVRVMGIVRVIVRTIRVIIMRGFGVLRGLGLWFKVFRSRAGKVLLQDFRLGYSRRSYIPTYLPTYLPTYVRAYLHTHTHTCRP